jgi:methyl-accepting chemotaxis protein
MFNKLGLSAKVTALATVLLVIMFILGIISSVLLTNAKNDSMAIGFELLPVVSSLADGLIDHGNLTTNLQDFRRSSRNDVAQEARGLFDSLYKSLDEVKDLMKTAKTLPVIAQNLPGVYDAGLKLKALSDTLFEWGRQQNVWVAEMNSMPFKLSHMSSSYQTKPYSSASSKDRDNLLDLVDAVAETFMRVRPILDIFDTTGNGEALAVIKRAEDIRDALLNSSTFGSDGKRDIEKLFDKKDGFGRYTALYNDFVRVQCYRIQGRIRQTKMNDDFAQGIVTMVTGMCKRQTGLAQERSEFMQTAVYIMIVGILVALVLGIVLCMIITKSIIAPITKAIEGLSNGADQLANASGEISSSSQDIASGSSQQASNLEEISSSVSEISSMTKQTADNVRTADALVRETGDKIESGKDSMDRLQKAVIEIQQSSSETAKILKDIDEIAFQTNLLALNAAVEAARAGEAGKGFAVVAEEVRNLAQRSAESAKKTAALIEESQHKSQTGVNLVNETASAMVEIADKAEKIKNIVSEITTASTEQARGVSQVSSSIGTVEGVTQANAGSSEELAASSEELSAQALSVNDLVGDLVKVVEGADSANRWATGTHKRYTNTRTTMRISKFKTPPRLPQKSASPAANAPASAPAADPHLISFDDDKDYGNY